MRPAIPQRRSPLISVRLALLSCVALAPFLTLLAPDSSATVSSALASALGSTPARPALVAKPAHHRAHAGNAARVRAPKTKRAAPTAPRRRIHHVVSYDRYSLLIDGRRVILFGGEYQFWRTPAPDQWPVVLHEMRAAGLNVVTVGVSWQYHSPAPGVYDFSGIRDLGRFLDDAAAAGLYVIARPGPAYNAEANASNLPGWLLARTPDLRANGGHNYCGSGAYSPAYAAAYTDWYRHVLPIIAARQLTNGGGTVVAVQIENEYSPRCGDSRYMSELHDLSRELGIDVPLIANNNTCCAAAGSWHTIGDDGQPIVDFPGEDDYPCSDRCPAQWDGRIFSEVDRMEQRLRGAGVTRAPITVAELQGGYFTGWAGPNYQRLSDALSPGFAEVLDGSVLGQGATIVSVYMVAGGTSWGYLAGPDTATSYDYDAAIHEWGEPSPTYAPLKRTAMFVQAFGDALAATRRSGGVTASDRGALYAVRQTVDGSQRGARFIVLRNTDPRREIETRLRLGVDGHSYVTAPIGLPPHSLAMLLAGYNLGPFRLRYSTSRPLTQATIDGQEVAVFYGTAGTRGETVLAMAHRPTVVQADKGIAVRYDARSGELRLDYRHEEGRHTVVLDFAGRRLVLILTGPETAARTWRVDSSTGTALMMGPSMVDAPVRRGTSLQTAVTLPGNTTVSLWAPAASRTARAVGTLIQDVAPHVSTARRDAVYLARLPTVRFDAALRAAIASFALRTAPPALPRLTTWRFMPESPEIAPSFDDAHWTRANERATSNPNVPRSDTLLADDYGFHYGFVWYRGTFTGTGHETGLRIFARNSYSVWLNGVYLGSSTVHNDLKNVDDQIAKWGAAPSNGAYADGLTFHVSRDEIRVGAPNKIAVLVESLGHNIGFANGQRARSPMGILEAHVVGSKVRDHIVWRLQGAAGGEKEYAVVHDGVDTPLNASGLYGERNGWYRTSFDDSSWPTVSVPDTWTARGLQFQGVGWYRTTFNLNFPAGIEAPLGLVIPKAQDKVLIWLNGLLIGQYWQGVDPQHTFYLPAGLLNLHGRNTLALAVWNRGHAGGLTGGVYLKPYSVDGRLTLGT